MTTIISNTYYPERKFDVSKQWAESHPYLARAKFLTELALPFISLYKPLGTPLSYGLGTLGVFQGVVSVIGKGSKTSGKEAITVAKGVLDFASTYFQYRAGLIASGMIELSEEVYNLYQGSAQGRGEHLRKALSTTLRLMTLVYPSSLEWVFLSLLFQSLSNFYQAYQTIQAEQRPEGSQYKWDRALKAITELAMGAIRFYQAKQISERIAFEYLSTLIDTEMKAKKESLEEEILPL